MADELRRIVVRELGPDGSSTRSVALVGGTPVTIGRAGPVVIGADDEGVSRVALTVGAKPDGWRIRLTNRNGGQLHPWAQATLWLPAGTDTVVHWPRVGVWLPGNSADVERWVLLESDEYELPDPEQEGAAPMDTVLTPRPRAITLTQLATVYATFPDQLAWPRVPRPTSRSLEAVAHRLGVSASAVRERLRPVQDRARDLGLVEPRGITEPDYVFHLAAHGYLRDVPPPVDTST